VKELVDGKLQKLTDVLLSLSVVVQKHAVVSCNTLVIFVGFLLLLFAPLNHRFALFTFFLTYHRLQDRVHHFLLLIFSSSTAGSSPYSQNSPHMPQAY
jgi:type II secretory pathway component PulF